MAGEDRIGRGSLGKSRRKTSENSPGYIGSLTFEDGIQPGEKVYIAAWVKQGQDGQFFSIVVTRPQDRAPGTNGGYPRQQPPQQQRQPAQSRMDMDDEIPF